MSILRITNLWPPFSDPNDAEDGPQGPPAFRGLSFGRRVIEYFRKVR